MREIARDPPVIGSSLASSQCDEPLMATRKTESDSVTPRSLAERVELAESYSEQNGFDRASWLWMVILGVIVPVVLLVLGWRFVA